MDRSLPLVIVNPRSGGGLDQRRWASLVGPLTDGLGPFESRFTEAAGHARHLAEDEARAGRSLVIAFGGDGTISEATDGLMAAGGTTELGFIPRGTGGDFRRTLDLHQDLAKAAAHIRACPARSIDVGRVTFTTADGGTATRHFINVASFGFSSDVASRANRSSKRLGAKVSFLGATLRSLVAYDNADVILTLDGGEPRRRTLLLGAVGNGRFFGGGMKICPEAQLDDGLLDVVAVGDLGRLEILGKIHRLYDGTHLSMAEVDCTRVRRLHVQPADPSLEIPVELDGETPGKLPATFEILPRALRLRA